MDQIEALSVLNDDDLRVLSSICERALSAGSLQAPIDVQDLVSASAFDVLGDEIGQSLIALMKHGYLDRAGSRRYSVTPVGFQLYARSHLADYGNRESAVKDAVAAVEATDTSTVMANTGETRLVVNHVLRMLQRDRAITGFVTDTKGYCVTRVSPAFKRDREALKAAG